MIVYYEIETIGQGSQKKKKIIIIIIGHKYISFTSINEQSLEFLSYLFIIIYFFGKKY